MTQVEFINYLNCNKFERVCCNLTFLNGETLSGIIEKINGNKTYYFMSNDFSRYGFENNQTNDVVFKYMTSFFEKYDKNVPYFYFHVEEIEIVENLDFLEKSVSNKTLETVNEIIKEKPLEIAFFSRLLKAFIKKPSLLTWAIELYKNGYLTTNENLDIIVYFNEQNHHLVKFLEKDSLVNYTTKEDINDLIKEIFALKRHSKFMKSIKMFNTSQRQAFLNLRSFTHEQKLILLKFEQLDKEIQNNIIKKVSPILDVNEILNIIDKITKDEYSWDYDDFITYLENKKYNKLNCKIVYSNPTSKVVILKVDNYETIKILGSQTSWCISRNLGSWEDYCGFNNEGKVYGYQYILYNFNEKEFTEKSMIGITLNPYKGHITSTHGFTNYSFKDYYNNIYYKNNNLVSHETYSIYEELKKFNISINDFNEKDISLPFQWSYEELKKYIESKGEELFKTIYNSETNTVILFEEDYEDNGEFFSNLFPFLNFYKEEDTSHMCIYFDFNSPYENKDSIIIFGIRKSRIYDNFIYEIFNREGEPVNVDILEIILSKGLNKNEFFSLHNPKELMEYYVIHNRPDMILSLMEKYPKQKYEVDFENQFLCGNIFKYCFLFRQISLLKEIVNCDYFFKKNKVYKDTLIGEFLNIDNLPEILNEEEKIRIFYLIKDYFPSNENDKINYDYERLIIMSLNNNWFKLLKIVLVETQYHYNKIYETRYLDYKIGMFDHILATKNWYVFFKLISYLRLNKCDYFNISTFIIYNIFKDNNSLKYPEELKVIHKEDIEWFEQTIEQKPNIKVLIE